MFNVLRLRKIKTDLELLSLEKHNYRLKEVKNADKSRKELNRYKSRFEGTIKENLNFLLKKYEITPRKNAVLGFEFVITASQGFFIGKSDDQIKKFFFDNIEFLKNNYFKVEDSFISYSIHMDEKTPHCHILMVPLVKDSKNKKINLSAKKIINGPKDLIKLQTNLNKYLKNKGYDLERGLSKKISKKQHQSLSNFYKNEALKEKEKKEIIFYLKIFQNFIKKMGLGYVFNKFLEKEGFQKSSDKYHDFIHKP